MYKYTSANNIQDDGLDLIHRVLIDRTSLARMCPRLIPCGVSESCAVADALIAELRLDRGIPEIPRRRQTGGFKFLLVHSEKKFLVIVGNGDLTIMA